ncbi:hypothetical protein ACFT0G_06005 [Streptomyces sp. NPDC057020]|uniref:hypothetical protein n=1 Tax=unclassified Streptomyces TaxID=2593676 RepID=UPI0036368885
MATTQPIEDVRALWGAFLDAVETSGEPVHVTNHGRPWVVAMAPHVYETAKSGRPPAELLTMASTPARRGIAGLIARVRRGEVHLMVRRGVLDSAVIVPPAWWGESPPHPDAPAEAS